MTKPRKVTNLESYFRKSSEIIPDYELRNQEIITRYSK